MTPSLQQQSGARAGSRSTTPSSQNTRVDTPEEQELRRIEARQSILRLYEPSEIERDYRTRLDDETLRQFGYDLFAAGEPPTGVRSGAIGSDYVLGVGDEIQVSFRGAENSNQTAFVDHDGRLIVGNLPPIRAAGRTLGQVRADLAAETRRAMLATDVYVSVGETRSASVFVGGEVARPGQYSLSSASGIATALAQAGGVRRSGSLRSVRLVRAGGQTMTVDLYGLLGIGAPPNVALRDGDRIIVPVIGPTIAIVGQVPRPGIYELRGRESVSTVARYVGGALRQRGAQVSISRIEASGQEVYLHAAGPETTVMGGDAVQIMSSSAGGTLDRVRLRGNVANPGSRSVASAGTIAALVGSPDNLRPDTYMLAAILKRRDPASGARVFEVVNLAQELRNYQATTLSGNDELTILSFADIQFLNSTAVREVIEGIPQEEPLCTALDGFSALVQRSGAERFSVLTRSRFVDRAKENESRNASMSGGKKDRVAGGRLSATSPLEEEEEEIVYDLEMIEDRCPTVFNEQPELMAVLFDHAVSVGGAVRRSGIYPIGGAVTARDLALAADGLLPGSRALTLDITRRHGGVERVDDGETALSILRLTAGDDVHFSALESGFEGRGVEVAGEVMRPGFYTVRKGERLSELLERAGGLGPYAYPYGTIFTRESVRERQREGFERTARELNNSLLSIAARSDKGTADGLAGVAEMVRQLTTTEPSGRMVVEADPRVLRIRPDLDTVLEGGDTIFVPKRPNYILALGDVNNPGALQFVNGKRPTEYLAEAGGPLSTADRKRAFMVLPDGTAQPIHLGGWSRTRGTPPPPGTTIIVPKNIDPLFRLGVVRDITAIIAQLATSVGTVAVLATR